MRPKRQRHHFHTFALDNREEAILHEAKNVTDHNLTNTVMIAVRTYVKTHRIHLNEKENESPSVFDFLRDVIQNKKVSTLIP